MAKQHSTRAVTRKPGDRPPTGTEHRTAIALLRKSGGAHLARPYNTLVDDTPANTLEKCRRIIDWFAHIEEPFRSNSLEAAKADVFRLVVEAMAHAETVLRQVGSNEDPEDGAKLEAAAQQRIERFVRPEVLQS